MSNPNSKPRFKSADIVNRQRPPTRQPNAFPVGLDVSPKKNCVLFEIIIS